MAEEMHKFKAGEMHSGTGRKGERQEEPVRDYEQAVAIGLSESGQSRKQPRKGGRKASRKPSRGGRK